MTLSALVVVAVLGLTLGACGDDGGSSGGGSTATKQGSLTGVTWVLDTAKLVRGAGTVTVTAEFSATQVAGESGCNRYFGPYRADPDSGSLTIGPGIGGTLMPCPVPRSSVERAYLDRLSQVRAYRIATDTLTMLDGDGKTLLTYAASNGAEKIQRTWNVTSFYTGTALQSPVVGSALTATFDGKQVNGDAGCNTFSGGYTVDGEKIAIGPLASTLRACADNAVGQQEQQYLAALALAKTFTVAGNRLDLFREDGGFAVSFEAAPGR